MVKVQAWYCGCGDDGAVEEVNYIPDGVAVPQDQRLRVDDWIHDALTSNRPGWGIDDGSQGEVTIDVIAESAYFDHHYNVSDCVFDPFVVGGEE